ncbi:hypothetical protein [Lachnospira hominis (ex Hitch et al. 2024)]|uniref:Fibronectin type-III domain-containing protein n=1 Tax=Lachnospira intestinalis TaxID=3133158 RepID=A0ABV1GNU8_9FIRM
MKKMTRRRITALFMAVLMVVGILPLSMLTGIFSSKVAAATKTYSFDATALTTEKDKETISGKVADDYVTVFGTVQKRVKKDTLTVIATELAKSAAGGYEFTVTGTATAKIVISSTGGSNESQFTLIDAKGETVASKDGKSVISVTGTTGTEVNYELEAGTYKMVSAKEFTSRGVRVISFEIAETPKTVTKEYHFDATTLTTEKDKETISGKVADDYVTVFGTVQKRVKKDTVTVIATELAKSAASGYEFTVTGTATAKIMISSTGGSNESQFTLIDAKGEAVASKDGKSVISVTGTTGTEVNYELEAGTYKMVSAKEFTSRGVRVISFDITETTSGTRPPRADWAEVAAPTLGDVKVNGGKITVPYTMSVGYDGADELVVSMKDSKGNVVKTETVAATGTSGEVVFAPEISDEYTFVAVASRKDCEDKTCEAKKVAFELPLATPVISSVTSKGDGKIEVVWSAVKEASSYNVYVDGNKVDSTKETSYTVSGLTVGNEYSFAVEAVRETPAGISSKSEVKKGTATADAQRAWGYVNYGNGASDSNAAYTGDLNEDGQVTLRSGSLNKEGKFDSKSSNNGKIVPASFDGLNFYYTAVPVTQNFTLRAKVSVKQWMYTNGQEGFGIMATDMLGGSGWNNSYMAIASKVEYYWNEELSKVTTDTTKTKVSQTFGIGSQEKSGITKDNIEKIKANDTATIKSDFSSKMYPLEQRYPSSGNLVGNYCLKDPSKPLSDVLDNCITEMYLTIQKNNTGYFVTYESVDGSYSMTKKYYDPSALSKIDEENVYVGFFTSRFAEATFSDVSFSTSDPANDPPAEEKPIEELVTNASFNSKSATGTSEYEFGFTANCDGTLTIRDSEGNDIVTDAPIAANTAAKPATTTLNIGKNTFSYVFTPNADYIPEKDMVMSSYEAIEGTFTVTYRTYGVEGQSLYVAPGKYGVGIKDDPMSIYDAVKYVQPGQTIVLMEGTYYLDKTVKIERGVNGTADLPIQMVADPEASSRPVLDFQQKCAGMVLAGDYWYFQGFDVTNSADKQKGIQLSGKHCTMDNINTYHNGNTGLQISRYLTTDEYDMWPAYDLILNCTSYGNADAGFEDADGFAAKLTVGDGIVFDGCISYNNADDGWDLFAKVQTGSIGAVTIKNSVAFGNGYLEDGTVAGNGNGFKLGGDSMSGKHVLENCVSFDNKAKGIDSNSCPDIIVKNCTTFNNESYNIALYTNTAKNTDFATNGVISYRTQNLDQVEQFKLLGTQDKKKVDNDTNYFWLYDGDAAKNSKDAVKADWFVSTDTGMNYETHKYSSLKVTRNADNTINMNGLLVLTDKAPANAGARMTGTASGVINVPESIKAHKTLSISGNNTVKGNTTDIAVIRGTETEIVWRIDADISTFDYIVVDDVVLDKSKYTVTEGSTVITFKASYIKSLKAGEHTFRAYFTDGYIAETKLEVIPDTGDFSVNMIVVYAGIMLLALLAGVVVFFEEKKRRI